MDNNNIEIFGNDNLHNDAVSKLYSGNDLEKVLKDENIQKDIFYDVLTPQFELVPVGLIVSVSGDRNSMLNILVEDVTERLIGDVEVLESGSTGILSRIDETREKVREEISKQESIVYIKDMVMKKGCDNASRRITYGVEESLKKGSSSIAICIIGKDNNVISLLDKDTFNVELLDEIGDMQVWYIGI